MSNEIIQEPRHTCALGAQQTVVSIERAIPIIHAGPGCGSKLHRGLSQAGGYQGIEYAGADAIPSSNMIEKDVVFGGTDKLRKLIDGTLKVMDGDFFVVLTSCVSEIIGDDVGNVVAEFRRKGVPIVFAETAGFKGDAYLGHDLVLQAIAEQHLQPVKTVKGFVNVFSGVPRHDPFWEGDLNEIKRLLDAIGLKANILFGHSGGGRKALEAIPAAEFNLLLSPHIGLGVAELLKKKFDIPYFHYPVIPVGGVETSKFLRAVGEYAQIPSLNVERVIREEEKIFYHYLVRSADLLTEFQFDTPKTVYNINDSAYALAFTKFLVNDMGYFPNKQYVTEEVPEDLQDAVRGYFRDIAPGISAEVSFTQDGGAINEDIIANNKERFPLILGSSWEIDLARAIGALHLSVGIPIIDRLVLHHSYVGYRGGLNLVEDIYGRVLTKARDY
jgi:nitrogenase molybdenum-iron protein beta chain